MRKASQLDRGILLVLSGGDSRSVPATDASLLLPAYDTVVGQLPSEERSRYRSEAQGLVQGSSVRATATVEFPPGAVSSAVLPIAPATPPASSRSWRSLSRRAGARRQP